VLAAPGPASGPAEPKALCAFVLLPHLFVPSGLFCSSGWLNTFGLSCISGSSVISESFRFRIFSCILAFSSIFLPFDLFLNFFAFRPFPVFPAFTGLF
jgi:hypothetical protein